MLVFTVFNKNAFMGFLEIVGLFFCFAKIKNKKVECTLGHAVVIGHLCFWCFIISRPLECHLTLS